MKKKQGCFLIGVTGKGFSKTEEALLGSVTDDPYDIRTFMKAVKPAEGMGHIGTELISTTEHTLAEREYFTRVNETTRGVNEAGLAFTCAMVFENVAAEKKENPTPYAEITEWMMSHCRTVTEAIELFQLKGSTNPPYSVLLADANGDLAHLEVGNFGIAVNYRYSKQEPGVVFAVNCYLSQSLVQFNAPKTFLDDPDNNNKTRRERGEALAHQFKGKLDVSILIKMLSDHANEERDPMKNPILEAWGYSICNHGTRHRDDYPAEDLPWGTVSAEVLQPEKRTLWYCYGWPCGQNPKHKDQLFQDNSWGKFEPFSFLSTPPSQEITHLTTPYGDITEEGRSSIQKI